jgi:hypothetical protein
LARFQSAGLLRSRPSPILDEQEAADEVNASTSRLTQNEQCKSPHHDETVVSWFRQVLLDLLLGDEPNAALPRGLVLRLCHNIEHLTAEEGPAFIRWLKELTNSSPMTQSDRLQFACSALQNVLRLVRHRPVLSAHSLPEQLLRLRCQYKDKGKNETGKI